MIKPVGHKLLVKMDKVEDFDPVFKSAKASGIALPEVEDALRRQAGIDKGRVVAIGELCWMDFSKAIQWCKEGDLIVFAKHAGKVIEDPKTLEKFIILNDEDVQAVIEE